MKLKKQNLFWGIVFIIMDIIAVVTEIVNKTAQNAGKLFFVGYIVACCVFFAVGVTYLILGIIAIAKGEDQKSTRADTKAVCVVAMFCAVAYALTYIKLPVSFLSLEIKDSIIVLCTLIFGPMAGLKIAILVPFLEMITHSSTGVYGLIMNILSSVTFALVAGIVYKYKRSFYGAIFALIAGVFSVAAVMICANLVITPLFMNVPVEVVVKMIPTLFLPFNIVKPLLSGSVVLLLYKPFSTILKRTKMIEYSLSDTKENYRFNKRSIFVTAISIAVIAISICIVLFVIIPLN